MCNYTYRLNPKKVCPYSEYFSKWELIKPKSRVLKKFLQMSPTLLLDNSGACLFHSRDKDLKKTVKMNLYFKELVEVLSWSRIHMCRFVKQYGKFI